METLERVEKQSKRSEVSATRIIGRLNLNKRVIGVVDDTVSMCTPEATNQNSCCGITSRR